MQEKKTKGFQKAGPGRNKLNYESAPLNIRVPIPIKGIITDIVKRAVSEWKKENLKSIK